MSHVGSEDVTAVQHSCKPSVRFAFLSLWVLFCVTQPNRLENVLDAFEFPKELEDFLVVFNQVGSEDAVERFDSVHGVLEVEGVPGGFGEVDFFGEESVKNVGAVRVVVVDWLLFGFEFGEFAGLEVGFLSVLYVGFLIVLVGYFLIGL